MSVYLDFASNHPNSFRAPEQAQDRAPVAPLRSLADRADVALHALAKAREPTGLAEWVEMCAPIAALILAARTFTEPPR